MLTNSESKPRGERGFARFWTVEGDSSGCGAFSASSFERGNREKYCQNALRKPLATSQKAKFLARCCLSDKRADAREPTGHQFRSFEELAQNRPDILATGWLTGQACATFFIFTCPWQTMHCSTMLLAILPVW